MCKSPILLFAAAVSLAAQTPGAYQWSATGPLKIARLGACAAVLPEGRMLVAGGQDANGALRSVELYQPDGSFAPAQDMLRARSGHSCTSLADGRILVAGGAGEGAEAETYDPVANTWTPAENGAERWNHTATLLPDGRVLLAGGETADGPSNLLEWFNPATNRIRPLPSGLAVSRTLHASALLADGSVLVIGGWNAENLLDSMEVVKLDGTVENGTAMPAARAGHTATALDTNSGCVLIAGGVGTDGDLAAASLYCAGTQTFISAGDMSLPRYGHLALMLPSNGKVLITGGFSRGETTGASELYDPDSNAFVPAGSLTLARLGIAAAADPTTGTVLAVGGYTADGPVAACGILHSPTVVFDKVRYVDGDAVTISGLTWTPGEKVNLVVSTTPFSSIAPIPLAQTFQATASALGRIQMTLFTANAANAGATYKITATGVTSGLTASNQARQIARTTMTFSVFPSPALTRQPVTLQAVVQPATTLDRLDGTVTFQLGSTLLGSVSSTNQFTNVSQSGQITDGTSNTILVGETLPPSRTGFGGTVVFGDGSVRTINPGGVFQLVTRDIPAGSPANPSVTGSYAAIASLYAPSSATTTVSVQKQSVNVSLSTPLFFVQPKVGDPIQLTASVNPTQQPFADVTPSGVLHVSGAPGPVIDVPLSVSGNGSRGLFTVRLPAGARTFSAQYDGDNVFLAGSVSGAGAVSIGKGTVSFALIPGKSNYTVGEPITMLARILHPKVLGATPGGQITRNVGPAQFLGSTVGSDAQNTGTIDTKLPVNGFPAPGTFSVTMNYSGDANFVTASAGTILTMAKATPLVAVIAPLQVIAGQQARFVVRTAAPEGLTVPPTSGQVTLTGVANGASANLAGNVATIRQTFPTAGTFSVSVHYAGDANYVAADSPPVQIVVQ